MGSYLSTPWRDLPQKNEYNQTKAENLKFLTSYRPQNNEARHLRILLLGPVGSGKSSFINSADSVLRGRMTDRAPTGALFTEPTVTKKYKTYKLHGAQQQCAVLLNDIMGFEDGLKRGVPVEDVKLALQGHVREDYQFVPGRPLTQGDPGYNSEPTLDDKVHVLVFVVSVTTTYIMNDTIVEKMRVIRRAASDMGIPQVAVITNIDMACSKTQGDIKNAYWSKYLKHQADKLSVRLHLPVRSIFLVKNYATETRMDAETDVLILMALKQMIQSGEDYLNELNDQ